MRLIWSFLLMALAPVDLFALGKSPPPQEVIDDIQRILSKANALQYGRNWQDMVKIEEDAGLRDKTTHRIIQCLTADLCKPRIDKANDKSDFPHFRNAISRQDITAFHETPTQAS